MVAHFGYKEVPSMEEIFQACAQEDLKVTMAKTSFFLSHENLVSTDLPGMARWREGLFVWMNRNSLKATDFFIFPPTGWWSWGYCWSYDAASQQEGKTGASPHRSIRCQAGTPLAGPASYSLRASLATIKMRLIMVVVCDTYCQAC